MDLAFVSSSPCETWDGTAIMRFVSVSLAVFICSQRAGRQKYLWAESTGLFPVYLKLVQTVSGSRVRRESCYAWLCGAENIAHLLCRFDLEKPATSDYSAKLNST